MVTAQRLAPLEEVIAELRGEAGSRPALPPPARAGIKPSGAATGSLSVPTSPQDFAPSAVSSAPASAAAYFSLAPAATAAAPARVAMVAVAPEAAPAAPTANGAAERPPATTVTNGRSPVVLHTRSVFPAPNRGTLRGRIGRPEFTGRASRRHSRRSPGTKIFALDGRTSQPLGNRWR